jgi:hypothetical protein
MYNVTSAVSYNKALQEFAHLKVVDHSHGYTH